MANAGGSAAAGGGAGTVKIEVKPEPDDGYTTTTTPFIFKSQPSPIKNTAPSQQPEKRIPRPSRGPFKHKEPERILHENRRRVSRILHDLARAHNWNEASGVLSVLLRGTPRTSPDDRRHFLVAMELHKGFGARNYTLAIKQIYDAWMTKLAWTKSGSKKKFSIHLELALFLLAQGNVADAHGVMKFLVQDPDSAREPTVNLMYGLISYQLWYSYLVQQMKMKGFDIDTPLETCSMPSSDGNWDSEAIESSNDAVDIEAAKFSAEYASESSVGNNKVSAVSRKHVSSKKFCKSVPAYGFYVSRSGDMNAEGPPSLDHDNGYFDRSIFFTRGLETSLLRLRFKHFSGDIRQSICLYRGFSNEDYYRDAAKHLRIAFHSTPPLSAALQPLIQVNLQFISEWQKVLLNSLLLLLGDRVQEALMELEQSCLHLNTALPFRLRARLMEVFHSNQTNIISSCYENVLKRDPTCNHSLERLIRMHKTENYSSMLLLEMIALHLDSANGNCNIWGEFASCFHRLLMAAELECEDRISVNVRRDQTNVICSCKVPKALTEGVTRDTWRVRSRWWVKRHFSKKAYLADAQAGDLKLLSCKAACASHLYGSTFEFVISVLSSLRKKENKDQMLFLCMHMQNSMKLQENLD